MKLALAFACVVAVAVCGPARTLPALSHEEVHDELGQYHVRYVTAEGTIYSEKGWLVPTPDGKGHVLVKEGEITWVAADGKTYTTKFSAGLDGFVASGDHLPKAPVAL